MLNNAVIVDYGPEFLGQAVKTDGGIVCVVPDHLNSRDESSAAMREMVRRLGGECGTCGNCPLRLAG